MTLPLWGQLQKSTEDTETIEQAIARMISEHNDDPESHMLEGQSIDVHRKDTVVDHPAGSIYPDKISYSDLQFHTRFENLGMFTMVGTVSNASWPGLSFDCYDGGADLVTVRANVIGIINTGSLDHDVLIDTYFMRDTVDDSSTFASGIYNTGMDTLSLGFRMVGGQIRGVYRSGSTEYETGDLFEVPQGEVVFVRVFYNQIEDTIYIYVNGAELSAVEPVGAISISNQLGLRADANTEEGGVYRVYQWGLSRSI